MLSLKSYGLLGKRVIRLTVNSGLEHHDKVPPLPCIFYCAPYGDLFFCLNCTSVDKPVLINVKIGWPHHKTHVLTIKIHDLIITTHGLITVYSDLQLTCSWTLSGQSKSEL